MAAFKPCFSLTCHTNEQIHPQHKGQVIVRRSFISKEDQLELRNIEIPSPLHPDIDRPISRLSHLKSLSTDVILHSEHQE